MNVAVFLSSAPLRHLLSDTPTIWLIESLNEIPFTSSYSFLRYLWSHRCHIHCISPSLETITGTITGLRNYGAFLELDWGMAGLLHISQISYDRVDKLETLFTIGQRCKVRLKKNKWINAGPHDRDPNVTLLFNNSLSYQVDASPTLLIIYSNCN